MANFWDRFTGKFIHQKIMSTYSVFSKPGSWARPFYWKTHPIVNWRILGRHTGRFSGKLIQTKCYISYVSVKRFEWMSLPVKRPVWKNSGWVFHDLPIRVKNGRLKADGHILWPTCFIVLVCSIWKRSPTTWQSTFSRWINKFKA